MHRTFFLSATLLLCTASAQAIPINAEIGDLSWHANGGVNADAADRQARVHTHLRYVVQLLRNREHGPRASERAKLLKVLAAYAEAGEYPQRLPGEPDGRPVFIDARGVHCAVAFLIAQSGAPELARRIARRENRAFLREMTTPGIARWASEHGFTLRELAMIQPSNYVELPIVEPTQPTHIDNAPAELQEHGAELTLLCLQHGTTEHVRLKMTSDQRTVDVRPVLATPFTECIAAHAREMLNTGANWFDRFDVEYRLVLPSRRSLLEGALEQVELSSTPCTLQPGPRPTLAEVDLDVAASGLTVRVRTAPRNERVAQCLAERAWRRLSNVHWGPAPLRVQTRRPIRSYVDEAQLLSSLRYFASSVGDECARNEADALLASREEIARSGHDEPNGRPEGFLWINFVSTVRAVEDGDYTVSVDFPSAPFRRCVEAGVLARFRASLHEHDGEVRARIDASERAEIRTVVQGPARPSP
ncbi:MAG: hypothetical protein AAF938_08535 [Myxococcota bacterium]